MRGGICPKGVIEDEMQGGGDKIESPCVNFRKAFWHYMLGGCEKKLGGDIKRIFEKHFCITCGRCEKK